jgi:predicted TIM-barrel fold metal-dependent hydrolase
MRYNYFHITQLDKDFYAEYLKDRMPGKFMDSHTHINLQDHINDVPEERIEDDWALQGGMHMTADDAKFYYDTLFPHKEWSIVAFPFPIREAKIEDNNGYVAQCAEEGKIAHGLMCIKPDYSLEYMEQELTTKKFSGVKPYPDMVSGKKGAEISIFEFLPHSQLALLEKLDMPVVLHLPRAGRMPDDNNINEIKEIRQKYPELKIIIAHFGRCFTPYYFRQAIDKMGEEIHGLYFDTAAVMNPEVHRIALDKLNHKNILFGTDQPIFLWHGRRKWTEKSYFNLAREDFMWNKNHEPKEVKEKYTFYVYEQINNLINEMENAGLSREQKEDIFYNNANDIFTNISLGGNR